MFANITRSQDRTLLRDLDHVSFKLNKDSLLKFTNSEEAIIFFCPNNYSIKKEEYQESLELIQSSYRIDSTIAVLGLSYENMNAMSNNPMVDSVLISELDCFLILNDTINLSRASRINRSFNHFTKGLPEGVYGIQIADGVVCPKNLATKISVYNDYLFEVFHPIYSSKERIGMLEEEIVVIKETHQKELNYLKQKIEELKKQIIDLDKRKRDVK